MIDRIVQLYEAFMAMPLEGQLMTGIGALAAIAAIRTVWKLTFPVRWTVASTLRMSAWLMHPRKRQPKTEIQQVADTTNKMVPFDFSTKENAKAAYAFYAGTNAVQALSEDQMELISDAVELYGLKGNMGLTKERHRRRMQERMTSIQQRAAKMQEVTAG